MIDLNKCEGWQKRDTDGTVMPWYTHPALDEIKTWSIWRKQVFEYGIGQSTLWWAKQGTLIVNGVDSNMEWAKAVYDQRVNNNISVEWHADKTAYVRSIRRFKADIVIIDGDFRDECVKSAIERLNKGGKLIIDNWDQPSVWVPNDETRKIVAGLEHTIYKQPGHPDWQTLIATK